MGNLGVKTRIGGTFDAELEFKDTGLVAASAAATVAAAAAVVDVGTGHYRGMMVIDVTALEVASTDEIYDIVIQGSPDATFTAATSVELCQLNLSAVAVKRTDTNKADTVGRYKLYFDNENDGTYYRYLRVYTVVAGTVATGINYSAWATAL